MRDALAAWFRGLHLLLLATMLAGPGGASGAATPVAADAIELQVFVREGCPHCAEAEAFLARLAPQRPALRIRYREVDRDPAARDELVARTRAAGLWPPGVPSFVVGDRLLSGFDPEHTPAALDELIGAGAAQAPPAGELRHPWFGTLSAARLGLPAFTLALGLIDGFNPCAMWVLLFLLALLLRLQDRRRMALVAGTFVLASGAVYYAFMAAWLNVFLAVGMSDALRLVLALLALTIGAFNTKDFIAFGRGPSLSIPAAARPGLYARMRAILHAESLPAALAAVALLAVLVNFVELLCTAGLPAIYTAVLTQQGLTPAAHYAYLGLYIAAYVADDALMVAAAVLALGSGRLGARGARVLKLLSGLVMLALGLVMLLRPGWLL